MKTPPTLLNSGSSGLTETWLGKRLMRFLTDYAFVVIARKKLNRDGDSNEMEFFENDEVMLASIVLRQQGWTLFVAPRGSPVDPNAVIERSQGWNLISEVWGNFYGAYHEARQARPYPHRLTKNEEDGVYDLSLREFMRLIRSGSISTSSPHFRLEGDQS